MSEIKTLAGELDQIIQASEKFKEAQERYLKKRTGNLSVEHSDTEKEYWARVHAEKPVQQKLSETESRNLFWAVAKELIPGYIVPDEAKKLYRELVNYFFDHPSEFDNSKGLLLIGGTGSGKTMFIKILKTALQYINRSFRFYPCMDAEQHVRFGGDYDLFTTGEICFDDLGTEQYETLFMGNRTVVMTEILQRRYNLWQDQNRRTIVTSNLLPEEIASRYGNRVSDRLNEMCNLVIFSWDSFRTKSA